MGTRTLGLDLGPNSIGWALVEDEAEDTENGRIVDIGVRVFPEGVDAFDTSKEVSRNEDRRIARGMRRQILRRTRRRRHLKTALIEIGLWPDDPDAEAELYQIDPYDLRSRALKQPLSPHEIGRLLLHLSQRRGFLSNRKKDRGDAEVKGMLAEINENENERKDGGFETIGAWLANKTPKPNDAARQYHCNRQENDHVRKRHLARQQYEDEFEAIWTTQAKYHAALLTEQLKYGNTGKQVYPCMPRQAGRKNLKQLDERDRGRQLAKADLDSFGIHGMIFFQRLMYWPKSVVGLCELEPKQKRAPRSDRRYQRFRMLQEVNNLRYIDPDTHTERRLTSGQRALLLDKLNRTKEMTFDQIRAALGFLESVKFNLERGKRSKIKGVPIDAMLATKRVLTTKWYDRSAEEKTAIVAALLDHEQDDDAFIGRAIKDWKMTAEQAEAALGVELPAGYASLSLMALEKLLPYMEAGLLYMADDESNSALHAAGYLRRDQLQRRIFDKLPNPQRVRDCPIGDIPNPVVKRTLTEVRRVVNAIIREHGKPDAIHIEMAREVQQGKQARTEYTKRIKQREAERERAAHKLREHNIRPTRDNILKYLLWEQQGHECIYSGQTIGFQKLFGEAGGVEVDHILPRSRTLDDSQMNRIVCLREANAGKGDMTPHEWLAESKPDQYEQVCQRAGKLLRAGNMPYPKYRRFIQKELDLDKFIARQLADTSYITSATAEFLRCLFGQDHAVLGLKGQLTAELRWHWGLETILEELPDSPGWQDKQAGKLRPGEKNRADHRHHAIDAVVVALTNRSRLQQLSRIVKAGGARVHGEILFDPWPQFRETVVDAVQDINVSHRAERKVAGRLHEETLYGPTTVTGEWGVRKPLIDLSPNEIGRIRDDAIRNIVIKRLGEYGIEYGRATSVNAKLWKEALSGLTMPSGVPIKKVRIIKPELTIQPIRQGQPGEAFVKPGSTHHLCIFEWEENGKRKRGAVFVTMLEATNRIKRQQQLLAEEREKLKRQQLSNSEFKHRLRVTMSTIGKKLPVIQRDLTQIDVALRGNIPADASFVMSLSRGELVLANWKGQEKLLKFKTAASTQGQIYFAEHTDARRSSEQRKYVANASTLDARKVTVDPLGRVRWAND